MTDTHTLLEERFNQLPEAVRNAITSADVSDHLRKLSDINQLHLDQWQELETEGMMTLMGIQTASSPPPKIQKTPPAPPATEQKPAESVQPTVVRKEAPEAYKPGQTSAERKEIHADPYRIAPDA